MASKKKLLAQLVVQIKEQGADSVVGALRKIDGELNKVGRGSGSGTWGASFEKQIQRLKLNAAELDKLRASFRAAQHEMGAAAGRSPAARRQAMQTWRDSALADILAVRAAHAVAEAENAVALKRRVADEKRAAAETAKAQARAAQDAAREKVKAVREAAREEKEAARQVAREATAHARQKRQEAREASREAVRAERAAHRARRDDARSARNVGRAVSGNVAGMAGIGLTAYGSGQVARRGVVAAAEGRREGARDYLAGLTPAETLKLKSAALATSAKTPSVDSTVLHETLRDAGLAMGDLDKAVGMADEFGKALTVLQSLKGKDQAVTELRGFVKALDNLDRVQDPKRVGEVLNGMVKALGVEGADLKLNDLFTFAKRAKSGGAALSDEFLYTAAPNLLTDMGADRAGTAIGSMVSSLIGGVRQTKAKIAAQREMGIRDKRGMVDPSLMMQNPFTWSEKYLVPALQNKKIDLNDNAAVVGQIAKLFQNQMVADLFTKLVTQRDQTLRKQEQYGKAPGLAAAAELPGKDPFVALEGLFAQLRNVASVAGDPALAAAGPVLSSVASGLASLSKAIAENPDLAGKATLAAGAAAATGGTYLGGRLLGLLGGQGGSLGTNAARALAGPLTGAGMLGLRAFPVAGGIYGAVQAGNAVGGTLSGIGQVATANPAEVKGIEDAVAKLDDYRTRLDELETKIASINSRKVFEGGLNVAEPLERERDRLKVVVADIEAKLGELQAVRAQGEVLTPAPPQRPPEVGKQVEASVAFDGKARANESMSGYNAAIAAEGEKAVATGQSIAARLKAALSFTARPSIALPTPAVPGGGAPSAPGRASGGPVSAGSLYQVGEHGPEFFVPTESGRIAKAGEAKGAERQRVAPTVHSSVTVNVHGEQDFHSMVGKISDALEERIQFNLRAVFADYDVEI